MSERSIGVIELYVRKEGVEFKGLTDKGTGINKKVVFGF